MGRADDNAGHTDSVTCARFNKDGKLVATAGLDACVKIWNTENGELLKTLEGPGEGLDVRLSLPLSRTRALAERFLIRPSSSPVVDVASARQRALGRLR